MVASLNRLEALDAAALRSVADLFEAAGYCSRVPLASESILAGELDVVRMPLVHRALLNAGDPTSLLAYMFLYDGRVARRQLDALIGQTLAGLLDAAGLIVGDGAEVAAAFRATPVGGTLILSDRPDDGVDAVMPPGVTTGDLLAILPSTVHGACLDVGSGPGTLALVLARRGGRVTAVDVNHRACRVARLNARLNGLVLDVREGDLFDPVAGERFALVVGQPPWVALPAVMDSVTYLHGGARGDELVLRLLRELNTVLEPHGVALLRFDAPVTSDDEDVSGRVGRCLDGIGGLLVIAPGPGADQQAVGYASIEDPALGAAYRRAAVIYRDHLEVVGVQYAERVIAVVTADAPVLHHLVTQQLPRDAETLAMLATGQALAAAPPEALAEADLTTLSGTVVSRAHGGAWTVRSPLGPALAVDERVARVVEARGVADGSTDITVDDVEAVREALRMGVVVPRAR